MILVSKGNQTNDVYTIDEKLIPGKLYMTEKYASAHRIVKFIRLKQNSFGTDDEQADPECLAEFVNESRKFIHLSELMELQWPYTTNILPKKTARKPLPLGMWMNCGVRYFFCNFF